MMKFINALFAFNVNGFNHIWFLLTENWAVLLILGAAVFSALMYVYAEIDLNVHEEQQIL